MTDEPQTNCKVILETNYGELCVDLWANETPKNSLVFL